MAPIISPIIIPEKQDKNLLILSQKTRQIIQLVIVNINVYWNENIIIENPDMRAWWKLDTHMEYPIPISQGANPQINMIWIMLYINRIENH